VQIPLEIRLSLRQGTVYKHLDFRGGQGADLVLTCAELIKHQKDLTLYLMI